VRCAAVITAVLLVLAPLAMGDWTIMRRLPFDPNMIEPEFGV
jgi:hypothetical protein